ncbi:hypothetical protein NLG97_g11164 [Lecanicillium saksenae]|uniref:Uncharacterized protein n=1 Tax=Lecanicillium saksenae TaxID=468837 RepID=A0ACC1QBP1_9HYPO|nr:hypothetical protein NLG97_g11164 [Lecanicillium saksenae]
MARQNTFTIIPQAPGLDANTAIPARPMTSKQVRKAYKASTKTPTMTRAERMKWEREEQERIKKEYEKERAAAKARAAREKKKEKDMQQREEKRRNGLPLVNVRPSQDTIARFVRGNGSKKKRDAEGTVVLAGNEADLDERSEGNHEDMTRPEAEPIVLGSIFEAEEELSDEEAPAPKENAISDASLVLEADNSRPERTAPGTSDNSVTKAKGGTQIPQSRGPLEEEYDVDLSLEEPIDEAAFDSALDFVTEIEREKPPSAARAAVDTDILRARFPQEPAKEFPSSQNLLDEDINTDMLEELDELLSGGKTPAKQWLAPESVSSQHTETPPAKKMKQQETPESMAMDKSPTSRPGKGAAAGRRVQLASSSPAPLRPALPTGTQAILVNFDDFFPTSSQQLRELEEERETSEPDIRTPSLHRRNSTWNLTNLSPTLAHFPPQLTSRSWNALQYQFKHPNSVRQS